MPQRFWHGAKNKQKIDKVSILCVHRGVPNGKVGVKKLFKIKYISLFLCFTSRKINNYP